MRQKVQSGINQLRLPGIFPDYQAPIVRKRVDGERELVMARWCPYPPSCHPKFWKVPPARGATVVRSGRGRYESSTETR